MWQGCWSGLGSWSRSVKAETDNLRKAGHYWGWTPWPPHSLELLLTEVIKFSSSMKSGSSQDGLGDGKMSSITTKDSDIQALPTTYWPRIFRPPLGETVHEKAGHLSLRPTQSRENTDMGLPSEIGDQPSKPGENWDELVTLLETSDSTF